MQVDDGDIALVQAAQGGDKGAFAMLLERHRPLLVALCRRMLGDSALADDAAQEAVLQALLGLDRLRRPDRFGPWLAGIGLNVCRRWLRERTRDAWSWEALAGGRLVREPVTERADPAELAEAADLATRLRRAVAELPRGQRAAVLLFYLSGLTHSEVAAALGIEVGAVKTRLHKARAALRRQLWTLWKEKDMGTRQQAQLVEMRVAEVVRQPAKGDQPAKHVVLLQEVGGARCLPIWIGRAEGEALALLLEQVETARPLTFAFMASLLRAIDGRLREVQINRLAETTFYSVAVVEGARGRARSVDARPSDALSLALVTGAPIRVESAVLEAAGAHRPCPPREAWHAEGRKGAAAIVAEITAGWPCLTPNPSQPR